MRETLIYPEYSAEHFASRLQLARLNSRARALFLALMARADDQGRLDLNRAPAGVGDGIEAMEGLGLATLVDATPDEIFPRPVIQINAWDYWREYLPAKEE